MSNESKMQEDAAASRLFDTSHARVLNGEGGGEGHIPPVLTTAQPGGCVKVGEERV